MRIEKTGTHPGPRAKNVHPALHGDTCWYEVDEFRVVAGEDADAHLVLRTRRGTSHVVDRRSPDLRRPHRWERIVFRDRFPRIDPNATDSARESVGSSSSIR